MARIARNFLPDFPVHVVHRGNNRQRIFTCEGDLLLFRRSLEEDAVDLSISVHSYVLMSNHVHLLLTPRTPQGISRLIQRVARRYVGYFNSRYRRTGTLWEGRFHSTVIGSGAYLLACHRYIENNPVRAGMVTHAAMYPWSSHGHNAGLASDSLVTLHPVVGNLAATESARSEAYRRMFLEPDRPEEADAFRAASRMSRPVGFADAPGRRPGRPRTKIGL